MSLRYTNSDISSRGGGKYRELMSRPALSWLTLCCVLHTQSPCPPLRLTCLTFCPTVALTTARAADVSSPVAKGLIMIPARVPARMWISYSEITANGITQLLQSCCRASASSSFLGQACRQSLFPHNL